ncbi:hypothetical protein QBC43DRAFT_286201 [Cladorrhinum sp. PSN259]|nr:hypothetical protein QBC43DRAFT_286201 [Cladorrhinum sp. PSN259]
MAAKTNVIPPLSDSKEGNNNENTTHRTKCSPLGLLKSSFRSLSHCWPSSSNPEQETTTVPGVEKEKYVHVPTHAAMSHLRTTSSPTIRQANEVL